jgi:hypothetical protein
MRNLLAALLCLPLVCCADDKEGASDPDAATGGDAEAARAPDGSDPGQAADDEDAGGSGSANDAGESRDASSRDAAATMDGGGRDGGMQPAHDAATDARSNDDTGVESDAGVGGAPRCTGSGLKFCDDFESATIDPGWVMRDGDLTIDRSSPAVRGQGSLHVHAVNNETSIMAHRASFPMPNERFWTRMFLKIKNLPTVDWAHWSILWTIPQGDQWSVEEHRAVGGQNQSDDKLYWGVGTDHGSSGDWTNIDTSSTVQLDRWICVETLIDANQDISQVYRDGVEIPRLGTTRSVVHGGNTPNAPYDIPAVRTLWLGFFYYQGETPGVQYDVWIDSFALDGERIGCTR